MSMYSDGLDLLLRLLAVKAQQTGKLKNFEALCERYFGSSEHERNEIAVQILDLLEGG